MTVQFQATDLLTPGGVANQFTALCVKDLSTTQFTLFDAEYYRIHPPLAVKSLDLIMGSVSYPFRVKCEGGLTFSVTINGCEWKTDRANGGWVLLPYSVEDVMAALPKPEPQRAGEPDAGCRIKKIKSIEQFKKHHAKGRVFIITGDNASKHGRVSVWYSMMKSTIGMKFCAERFSFDDNDNPVHVKVGGFWYDPSDFGVIRKQKADDQPEPGCEVKVGARVRVIPGMSNPYGNVRECDGKTGVVSRARSGGEGWQVRFTSLQIEYFFPTSMLEVLEV